MLRIALFGYGRMGREIERVALTAGHTIVTTFDPSDSEALVPGTPTPNQLSEADVCIDFSLAEAVLPNLEVAAAAGKPVIIGTTAWESGLPQAREIVERHGTAMLHAPNFSIGVQTLFRLTAECAKILNRIGPKDTDVGIIETHHRGKADSPSGTAKRLAQILLDHLAVKDLLVTDEPQRPMAPNEIHVVGHRMGAEPGAHTVAFDLGDEVLEIRHRARSRAIFARGAVQAAEWIVGRKGVFELTDMLFPGGFPS